MYPTLNKNYIVLCHYLAEIDGNPWQPSEFKNVANPDFEHLKHLQNPGHFSLTEGFIYIGIQHILTSLHAICEGENI